MPNRHSKKTKVSGSANASPQPPPPPPPLDDKEIKATANGTKKVSRSKRKLKEEEAGFSKGATAEPVVEAEAGVTGVSGKVPIPRLVSANRSSPARLPALALVPGHHSQSPSPTSVGKPKFVPIQPKPSSSSGAEGHNGLSGLACPSLPQLKEEDSNSRPASDLLEGGWGEGACHDEELANYWSVAQQPGESITENSLSPKPAQQAQTELSQLRVLLEQNEGRQVDWRMIDVNSFTKCF